MGKPKLSIYFIRNEIKKYGYELISEEYINVRTNLEIKCLNGHLSMKSWEKIKEGRGCKKCASEKLRTDFEIVKNEFSKRNYTLTSATYIGAHDKLTYICPNGHEGNIAWHEFKRGEGCNKCAIENKSYEKSTSWNPNLTDKERIKRRQYREIRIWRKEIKKIDNNTCQCCGNTQKIVVHHILNFTKNKEFRHDIRNGIVLCQKCHLDFHEEYSKKNNDGKQLYDFILSKKPVLDERKKEEMRLRLIDTVKEMKNQYEKQ